METITKLEVKHNMAKLYDKLCQYGWREFINKKHRELSYKYRSVTKSGLVLVGSECEIELQKYIQIF